jgi:chromosome segregation ATPase
MMSVAGAGMIRVGDLLASVSGVNVKGLPGDVLRDMLVGEPGSSVRVGFERTDKKTGRAFFYEVSLERALTVETESQVPFSVEEELLGEPAMLAEEEEERQALLHDIIKETPAAFPGSSAEPEDPFSTPAEPTPLAAAVNERLRRTLWNTPSTNPRGMNRPGFSTLASDTSLAGDLPAPPKSVEAIMAASSSAKLSRSSLDPYSVLDKKREGELGRLRAELESIKAELATARNEAKEARHEAYMEKERADHEASLRTSEEKRRLDVTEREKKTYEAWVQEHDKLQESERERAEIEMQLAEANQALSRVEAQTKALGASCHSLGMQESELKARALRLDQELRDSQAEMRSLQESTKHLREELEHAREAVSSHEGELAESRGTMFKLRTQLQDALRRAQEAEAQLDSVDTELTAKNQQLTIENSKLQHLYQNAETAQQKHRAELETALKKMAQMEEAHKDRGNMLAKSQESERQLITQRDKDSAELKRLREVAEALEKEVDRCRGELETAHAQRKLDKNELLRMRAKLDEVTAELENRSSEEHKERMTKSSQDEREKQLQSAMIGKQLVPCLEILVHSAMMREQLVCC